ncbi:PDZ domain-containing protein [Rheinheimera sp. F8]|uniref:M61 family metallopeptidase n=1 Tax=Rheinheimera sp. F8 TaxID=1763998 RepID=UPI000744BAEB|nr:PDZ domain-containing protein [Rheinheimera sp. F8]ALZ74544.1 peptidase M61 [Rheinheimera sp. F8]
MRYLSLLLAVIPLWASAAVDYQIKITDPDQHLADIQIKMTAEQAGAFSLKLPAWRSGKYQILDLANGVRRFEARLANGQPVPVEKAEKSTWQLQLPAAGDIVVSYQIYANELNQRTRHIDDTHAYINASAFLMYHDAQRKDPVTVSLQVPQGWRSTSGMTRTGDHSFKAADYDVLADSPIETGIHQSFTFKADGRDYEVVFWGQGNFDATQTVKDFEKIVLQASSIWQGYPYQNYLFIVHAASGARGATEHLNSTVIQRDRFSFRKREHYLEFLSTAAHELVHTWNVKAYRPAELVPYDYLQPNYSKLLWISEGSTSYFQNQLLLRAGLMTPQEFYNDLAKRLKRFERTPGREIQSVAQSSFDNWISLGGDHADNFSVNIYSEGYLVSWMLDHFLMNNSGLKSNYRTLHNELYQRFGKTTAFTAADVQKIAMDLTGQSLAEFWLQQVETPLELDAETLLKTAGLQLVKPKPTEPFTGLTVQAGKTGAEVSKVERDSPAWVADFSVGDHIIALDGLQLQTELAERLKDFPAGTAIKVTLFRDGRLLERQLTPQIQPAGNWQVVPVAKPSRQQKAYYRAWLGVDLPAAK